MAIATIDFQYSGVDSIYKDFVSLECSLRVDDLRQPVNDVPSFVERVKNEHALLKGRPVKSVAYLALCEQIRKSARECASRSGLVFDMNLYVLALGFHLLKVLGITGLPQEATGQALALFCACGVYLQDV